MVLVRVCDVVCQVLCHLPVDSWQGRSADAARQGLRRMTEEGAMGLLDVAARQVHLCVCVGGWVGGCVCMWVSVGESEDECTM